MGLETWRSNNLNTGAKMQRVKDDSDRLALSCFETHDLFSLTPHTAYCAYARRRSFSTEDTRKIRDSLPSSVRVSVFLCQ